MLNSIARSETIRIIGRRLLQGIPVLFGVTFITFCLMNLLPGDAATALLGQDATKQAVAKLTAELGLDHPLFYRYFHWLGNLLTGHLGTSLLSGQPVSEIIRQRLPVSLEIASISLFGSLILSVPVAVLAALKPRGVIDRVNMFVSMCGISIPGFVVGLILIIVVTVKLGWLPSVGFVSLFTSPLQNIRHIIMPCVTLGFGGFCASTRILRADLTDQMLGEDYILTATAKGLTRRQVVLRHALRNSMFTLLTLVGLSLGTIIGGTVIIEQIFGIPGMGQELLYAISNGDVPVVETVVVLVAAVTVVGNLVTDLLYAVLDPRIRYGRADA
jgi:peptide/nickel transport system permease protein